MALESFLVALEEVATREHVNNIQRLIKDLGGKIEFVAADGKVIISTIDSDCADRLRKLPWVILVGGVTFGKKEFKKIRVQKNIES
jgi:hypothetical protein